MTIVLIKSFKQALMNAMKYLLTEMSDLSPMQVAVTVLSRAEIVKVHVGLFPILVPAAMVPESVLAAASSQTISNAKASNILITVN